jgi:4-amino-4-deoxy-L-arabinose transferase-like glycosyltransferase
MSRIKHSHALLFMLFCLMVATTLRFPDLPTAPPGVHYDEAANGVLAAEIGLKGKRPIFISSYTGKEVLFFYLAGGLMRLLGDSVFTLRFTSALVGLVTVAATYWLGMELFRDRRIALIATALLAISFWHLLLSRLGFRAITQPLLQALTVAAFLRGARQNQWRWFLISGSFLGLTGYTYLAARLFPLLLVTAVLPLLLNRQQLQRRWSQLGVFILTALALLAPLLVYFVLYPDAFWVRITQVAPGESGLNVSESFVKSLQMYFLLGDPYWRFNLPGRPLFDWFWGSLLVVGWVVLLVRWRKLEIDWQRTAFLFCILAPFIMILPTALATNEIVPSNLRAIGLIPFIFYLPAIGLMFFLADLEQRYQRPKLTSTILVVGLLALAAGGLFTERLYFRHWATLPEVYFESDGDLTAVAQFLDTYDTTDKTVYVAALHYQHPTLAFLSDKYGEVKWLPRSEAVVFPAKGTAVYFYPHNSPLPAWAVPYFQTANLLDNSDAPDGTPAFVAYENSQTPSLMVPNPVNINFDHAITLLGYDLDTGTVGEKMPITLYWRVERSQTADFTPFVHLEDVWQYRWSQVETFAYPGGQWTAGETIIQQIDLPIPPGTPPGTYRLRVGLFSGLSGEQLMRLDENGLYLYSKNKYGRNYDCLVMNVAATKL